MDADEAALLLLADAERLLRHNDLAGAERLMRAAVQLRHPASADKQQPDNKRGCVNGRNLGGSNGSD